MREQVLQDLKAIQDWKHNGYVNDVYNKSTTLTQRLDIDISVESSVNSSSRILFWTAILAWTIAEKLKQ